MGKYGNDICRLFLLPQLLGGSVGISGDRLQPLLKPLASELMESHAVGTKVNSPKNNTPECLQPLLI